MKPCITSIMFEGWQLSIYRNPCFVKHCDTHTSSRTARDTENPVSTYDAFGSIPANKAKQKSSIDQRLSNTLYPKP